MPDHRIEGNSSVVSSQQCWYILASHQKVRLWNISQTLLETLCSRKYCRFYDFHGLLLAHIWDKRCNIINSTLNIFLLSIILQITYPILNIKVCSKAISWYLNIAIHTFEYIFCWFSLHVIILGAFWRFQIRHNLFLRPQILDSLISLPL